MAFPSPVMGASNDGGVTGAGIPRSEALLGGVLGIIVPRFGSKLNGRRGRTCADPVAGVGAEGFIGGVFGVTGTGALAGGALGGVFGIANPGPGRGSSSASAPRISRFNCRRVRLKIGDRERSATGTSCCLSARCASLSSSLSRICASK